MVYGRCAPQPADAADTFCLALDDASSSGDMMTDSLLGDCALDSMPLLAFGVRVPDLACYHSSQRLYTGQSHACFAVQCAFAMSPILAMQGSSGCRQLLAL